MNWKRLSIGLSVTLALGCGTIPGDSDGAGDFGKADTDESGDLAEIGLCHNRLDMRATSVFGAPAQAHGRYEEIQHYQRWTRGPAIVRYDHELDGYIDPNASVEWDEERSMQVTVADDFDRVDYHFYSQSGELRLATCTERPGTPGSRLHLFAYAGERYDSPLTSERVIEDADRACEQLLGGTVDLEGRNMVEAVATFIGEEILEAASDLAPNATIAYQYGDAGELLGIKRTNADGTREDFEFSYGVETPHSVRVVHHRLRSDSSYELGFTADYAFDDNGRLVSQRVDEYVDAFGNVQGEGGATTVDETLAASTGGWVRSSLPNGGWLYRVYEGRHLRGEVYTDPSSSNPVQLRLYEHFDPDDANAFGESTCFLTEGNDCVAREFHAVNLSHEVQGALGFGNSPREAWDEELDAVLLDEWRSIIEARLEAGSFPIEGSGESATVTEYSIDGQMERYVSNGDTIIGGTGSERTRSSDCVELAPGPSSGLFDCPGGSTGAVCYPVSLRSRLQRGIFGEEDRRPHPHSMGFIALRSIEVLVNTRLREPPLVL